MLLIASDRPYYGGPQVESRTDQTALSSIPPVSISSNNNLFISKRHTEKLDLNCKEADTCVMRTFGGCAERRHGLTAKRDHFVGCRVS